MRYDAIVPPPPDATEPEPEADDPDGPTIPVAACAAARLDARDLPSLRPSGVPQEWRCGTCTAACAAVPFDARSPGELPSLLAEARALVEQYTAGLYAEYRELRPTACPPRRRSSGARPATREVR